jgi:hypothetical protein
MDELGISGYTATDVWDEEGEEEHDSDQDGADEHDLPFQNERVVR